MHQPLRRAQLKNRSLALHIVLKGPTGAIDRDLALEGLGFRPEAILRDHVRDPAGAACDLVVLSQIVSEAAARLEAYGAAEASE